jgi:hypothetical protein
MRRVAALAFLLLLCGSALPGQGSSIWESSVRTGPQFFSYDLKTPVNEKVSQLAFPLFVVVPITPALSLDVGTAFAMVNLERQTVDGSGNPVTETSKLSGLTDTQIRGNYTFGQDFVVLTAGVNLPTGSATVAAEELEAAARIGSDFLTFPISGFGSGLGITGGFAVARPLGAWNLGFGASMRRTTEYEPFRNASGTATKFEPGAEYRARVGVDHPFGTGRVSFGFSFSKFGDDKADTSVYNTGDRYVAQVAVSNSFSGTEYAFVVWNLYRTGGTLLDQSPALRDNITNALFALGFRAPGGIAIEPSIETRLWTQQGSEASVLGTLGLRFYVNRGFWAIVPGAGYTFGSMATAAQSATFTGFRGTLALRFGGS